MKTTTIFQSLALAFALLVGLLALPANAAQTGELQGYVVDDSGLPITGARVILTSPQMIGGEKVQVTDADGRFRYSELDPGVYTVVISHPSFRGFTEEGIEVGIDAKVIRDYLLEPAGAVEEGEEVIRVVATAPMVDTTRTSQGISIRPEFTDRTVTSRSYQGVALFTPGVVGGATAPGNPSIHGGTPFSNVYLLDGLNITDPVTQTFSTNFNFDAIGELQVLTGGLDAEYGGMTGGLMNIVTKSGGDEFELDASAYWMPKELQLTDPGEVIDQNEIDVNLSIGGPIIKKKLWFFVSGQYLDIVSATQMPAGTPPVFPGVDEIPSRRFNAFFGLGKLKWQLLPWQKLTLLMQGDPTWITNEKQDPTTHPAAEGQRFQGGVKIIGTSETTLSESLFWKTSVGYGSDRLHLFPMSNDLTTPGHVNVGTGTGTINDTRITDDQRFRLHLNTSLTHFIDGLIGDHELKAGMEGALTWNDTFDSVPGNPDDCPYQAIGCVFTDNGILQTGSTIEGVGDPYQVTVYEEPLNKTVTSNQISLYVQDTWRPFRSLTLRPGLRFDSSRGYQDQADGGAEIFNFNTLSPRLGAAWDPFGDGKTSIRGGYHVYHETGLLLVPGFVGRSLGSTTWNYNPATEKYDILDHREGGEAAVLFKENMVAPIEHEVTFGVQRELFEDAALTVDFTYRRRQNMFEDDETNVIWNSEGTDIVGYRNGKAQYFFSVGTPDDAMGQYVGLDVYFEKRLSDNWQALITYTLSQLEGTVENLVTYSFDNPRQAPYEYGYLADDVRHKARVTLSYDFPYGFQLGGTAIYQSGRPESKLFLNNFYGSYYDRRAPRGYDPKDVDDPTDDVELRLPDFFYTNVRLAWRLKELTSQDIWLIADVVNLLNTRPPLGIETRNITDPNAPTQFGDPIGRGDPTSISLALRYQF
ncbi:MAG: TonB-dependent receptor [Deltaproteobacteria bacterium]|nr:TonB-dependent receptor [Deltaproteobacteria bacterium]